MSTTPWTDALAALISYAENYLPTENDAKNDAAMNEGRCSPHISAGLRLRQALTRLVGPEPDGGWGTFEDMLAVARLADCAEEMLAALEGLAHIAVWDDEFTTEEEFDPVMAQARAALNRAKGEA